MATAEKTQDKQKQFQVPDYSDEEDYDSADDYTDDYTDEEDAQTVQTKNKNKNKKKNQQLQRRQQSQKQDELEEYSDDDDYSDEYDDEYSDDDVIQGKSMQPYNQRRSDDKHPSGGMNVIDQKQPNMLDEEGMKLRLELNLEIEIELKARIHGDLTLALMS